MASMTGVAVSAGRGGGECHALELGAAAACVGVWLVRHVVVEVVVAAGLGSDRSHRGRRPFTMTAEVAGVEATSEGEVNHRCDGRDDADKGSHGGASLFPHYRPGLRWNSSVTQPKAVARLFFCAVFRNGAQPILPGSPGPFGPSFGSGGDREELHRDPSHSGLRHARARAAAGCRSAPRSARG